MNSNEENKQDGKEARHSHGPGRPHHHHHGRGFGPRWYLRGPIMAAVIFAKAGLIMVLWNALVPDLFHGPSIEYLQAFGLMILAKLLVGFGFGGFRGPFGGPGFGRGFGGPPWRGGPHWANLSPEEREKLRDKLRERCR